jgi:hypothetical protein
MGRCSRDINILPQVSNLKMTSYGLTMLGLFMGLLALFFILSIAFVGVNALGSLEVSYAAFDKENGPAAQKKQQ